MNEHELIKKAITSNAGCPSDRTPEEIIAQEGRGAMAHIRKRRFRFITVTAAAAVALSACVLMFKRLAEYKPDPGREISSSQEDSSSYVDTGDIIKLCDFTGTTGEKGVDLDREPANLPGYHVLIGDHSVTVTRRNGSSDGTFSLIGAQECRCVIKVYTANVTGGDLADVCIEAKPSYDSDRSAVYVFDIENDKKYSYYVPGLYSCVLKDESGKLLIGSRSGGSGDYEWSDAKNNAPAAYTEAVSAHLETSLTQLSRECSTGSIYYQFGQFGIVDLGGSVYRSETSTLYADLTDISTECEPMLSRLAQWLSEGKLTLSATPCSINGPTFTVEDSDDIINIGFNKTVEGEGTVTIGNIGIISRSYGNYCVFVETYEEECVGADESPSGKGRIPHCYLFDLSRDALEDISSLMTRTAAKDTSVHRDYYCPDISSLGISSPADRMIVPINGDYAVSYHFETDGDILYLVVDSVQLPEGVELTGGKLWVGSNEDGTALSIDADSLPGIIGERSRVPFKSTVKSILVQSGLTFTGGNSTVITHEYSIGGSRTDRAYTVLADFSGKQAVTRLSDGSQIRFDRYLDAFPGRRISITDSSVTAGDTTVASGRQISRVLASDLNDDNNPEVIVEYCVSDPGTESSVSVCDLSDGSLTELPAGCVLDASGANLMTRIYGSENSRSTLLKYSIPEWNERLVLEHFRAYAETLDEKYGSDPGSAEYWLALMEPYTDEEGCRCLETVQQVEGRCYELHDIMSAIISAIDSGSCDVFGLDEAEQIGSKYQTAVSEYNYDSPVSYAVAPREGTMQVLIRYLPGLKQYVLSGWINEMGQYFLLLPQSVNSTLDFMLPENLSMQSIEREGAENGREIIDAEDYKNKEYSFTTLQDHYSFSFVLDAQGEKGSLTIKDIKTAEGVSVEQYEIEVRSEVETADEYNDTLLYSGEIKNGTYSFDIKFGHDPVKAEQLPSMTVSVNLTLRLPDGSTREITRAVMYNKYVDEYTGTDDLGLLVNQNSDDGSAVMVKHYYYTGE
ncbi:MAG: hypothetical protein IKN17_10765 [Ruminococcus sp.]|nr:hypothetical protein [Ruminococcus sp.]